MAGWPHGGIGRRTSVRYWCWWNVRVQISLRPPFNLTSCNKKEIYKMSKRTVNYKDISELPSDLQHLIEPMIQSVTKSAALVNEYYKLGGYHSIFSQTSFLLDVKKIYQIFLTSLLFSSISYILWPKIMIHVIFSIVLMEWLRRH